MHGQIPAHPGPRRWWALAALVAAMLVLGFDATILNIALPTMSAELGADLGEQQWIADSYTVVFAAVMLPAGLLGDRFGRRRMLATGLLVFLAGSVLGALVGTPGLVITARVVMGLGAALITPLALSTLPALFGPEERSRAVAAMSAAMAAGLPLGPLAGGLLLEHFWWGSVFLVNIPMAILGLVACLTLLPETSDPATPRIDLVSTVLVAGGLAVLVYGIIEGPTRGWRDPLILTALGAGVVLLTGLVLRERRAPRPLLDLPLLRQPGFRWNALASTLVTFTMMGLLFLVPQYLQAVLGHDAFGTGLRLLPMMAGLLLGAKTAAPAARLLGPRPVVVTGLLVLGAAALLGSRTEPGDGYPPTALWLAITGFGAGFGTIPAMDAALGALPKDRAGSGSGLLMTLRQVGAALGVALLGSLLAGGYRSRLDTSGLPAEAARAADDSVVAARLTAERLGSPRLAASADAAFVHGMGVTLLVTAGIAVAAALLLAFRLPNPRGVASGPEKGEVVGPGLEEGDAPGLGPAVPGLEEREVASGLEERGVASGQGKQQAAGPDVEEREAASDREGPGAAPRPGLEESETAGSGPAAPRVPAPRRAAPGRTVPATRSDLALPLLVTAGIAVAAALLLALRPANPRVPAGPSTAPAPNGP
ncbi:MFS transporter [Streptomyces palmae]|uniref:DHA2 family efflux MFS transporter permease subunit n=1 Tax=Streptomyces palmae TaxID=1701085 RepID=A0A4Z0H9I0_9ACTN|nr:MFS transporter [Streptomyces palmae]TGB09276.1 DHA2 family efflux MFS transporter permease subunit [Streptomyces palmae]